MKPEVKVIRTERKTVAVDFYYGKNSGYYSKPKPYKGFVRANINEKKTSISVNFPKENVTVVLTTEELQNLVAAAQSVLDALK